jgi:hypothetical protein
MFDVENGWREQKNEGGLVEHIYPRASGQKKSKSTSAFSFHGYCGVDEKSLIE